MDQRYKQAKKLFLEVCDLNPTEREAVLDSRCGGDGELRAEVMSLLDHQDAATATFAAEVAAPARSETAPPRRIGPYRVIREIGRGGMGVVYLGVREDDRFKRRVAIKVLKRGMDTEEILKRFELERQLLAALNHPGIARLYDGGETEEGLPYFVMEYIEGRPIDRYCDTHRLRIAERLELFRTACSAIHYAHQNLIVHRDLKPSNIIVTKDGVPKLLDFGIAKLINPEMSLIVGDPTAPELRVMTPEYASPEQVRGDPITTASDIYSLGVLLYVMVTGHRPYRLRSRIKAEIEHVICDVDPERPSTAVSRVEDLDADETGTGTSTSITPELVSKVREGRPDRLRRRLAGDIDNIVLMAMRKEPQRRYKSAEQFAEDIGRHLDGMPVIARNDTVAYRFAKFVRRHRGGVAAAAVITLLLLGGIVGTASGWSAESIQRRQTELERNRAEAERNRAEAERDRAEEMTQYVLSLANLFLYEFHDAIETLDGSIPARLLLVQTALDYLDGLSKQVGDDFELNRALAAGYDRVGEIRGGIRNPSLGDTGGAMKSFQTGLEIRQRLLATAPADKELRVQLAASHLHVGDMHRETGDISAALAEYDKALAIAAELADEDPQYRRTLSVQVMSVGDGLVKLGRLTDARGYYERAMQLRERLAREAPMDDRTQRDLALAVIRNAEMQSKLGTYDLARLLWQRTIEIRQSITLRNPDSGRARRDLAVAHYYTGEFLLDLGYTEEAAPHIDHMARTCEQRVEANLSDARSRRDLARARELSGLLELRRDHLQQALDLFEQFNEIASGLVRLDPANAGYQWAVEDSEYRIAMVLARQGRNLRAATGFENAIESVTDLVDDDPANASMRIKKAEVLTEAGRLFLQAGDDVEAHAKLDGARDDYERLLEIEPASAPARVGLAEALAGLVQVMDARGYLDQAAADAQRAIDLLEGLEAPRTDKLRDELSAYVERHQG